jgi:hypothetical protein
MAPKATDRQIHEAMLRLKSTTLVAKQFGIVPRSVTQRLARMERRYGITYERVRANESSDMREMLVRGASGPKEDWRPTQRSQKLPAVDNEVRRRIMGQQVDIRDLASSLGVDIRDIDQSLVRLKAEHLNVHRVGDLVSIEKQHAPMAHDDDLHVYRSNADGYYRMGLISDNHYGSRFCRTEVNDDLYDWFAAQQVDRVYNAGNYIEGEAPFNRFELTHVGMEQQVRHFCERYPNRPGITTYFIAGDDHEGWYQQKTGINIGTYTENMAREGFGRLDLRYIGYVEAFIALRHAKTGASAQMLIQHPGGGTAYAISYQAQKAVESLAGGEKPAVYAFGHWHKMFALLIRNVICIGAGCTKDLDAFGRKKRLAYHIGGTILELWQNPETGAIERWRVEQKQYFDRGYYNGQYDNVGTAESL